MEKICKNENNSPHLRELSHQALHKQDNGKLLDAQKIWSFTCKCGDGMGCYWLGVIDKVSGNISSAMDLYKKSCNFEYAKGCGALGDLYLDKGEKERGLVLWKKACTMGQKRACLLLNKNQVPQRRKASIPKENK